MDRTEGSAAEQGGQFHRLVPPLIGEMAVVRHQVYWFSGPTHDRLRDNVFERGPGTRKQIWPCDDMESGPFRVGKYNLIQRTDRMKYVYVWWRGMLAHVRVMQHTEYISILTSLNFSRDVAKGESGVPNAGAYADAFRADRDEVRSLFSLLGSPGRPDGETNIHLQRLLGPLQAGATDNSLFVAFDGDFKMAQLCAEVLSPPSGQDRRGAEMIIDFRGLVTSASEAAGGGGESTDGGQRWFWRSRGGAREGRQPLFKRCFADAAMPRRETGLFLSEVYQQVIEDEQKWLLGSSPSPWFLTEIGKYWRAVRPDQEVADREEIEFTATGLLDGGRFS